MSTLLQRIVRYTLGALCLVSASIAYGAEPIVLSLGVTPQHSPGEQAKLWVPICQYISKRTGQQIQFKTSKDLATYWKEAEAGPVRIRVVKAFMCSRRGPRPISLLVG